MENFKIDVDSDGIALITFDVPGRSMNTITGSVMRDLITLVETIKSDDKIKGAVITSGKTTGFCAGADLGELNQRGAAGQARAEERRRKAEDASSSGLHARTSLSATSKPAASRSPLRSKASRSAAASKSRSPATIASPPTIRRSSSACRKSKVGLLPGAGGTQRLPRLIGVQNAAMMILQGAGQVAAGSQGPGLHQRSRAKPAKPSTPRRRG